MFKNEQFKMKEGVLVINYFAHCVDVEELYKNEVAPVCEKYGLTYMEFTVLMFLAIIPSMIQLLKLLDIVILLNPMYLFQFALYRKED